MPLFLSTYTSTNLSQSTQLLHTIVNKLTSRKKTHAHQHATRHMTTELSTQLTNYLPISKSRICPFSTNKKRNQSIKRYNRSKLRSSIYGYISTTITSSAATQLIATPSKGNLGKRTTQQELRKKVQYLTFPSFFS